MPAPPELAGGPSLLFAVVFHAGLGVAVELCEHEAAITAQAGFVASRQPIADCIGGEYPGSQRLEDALRRERVEPRGGVADRQPVAARYGVKAARLRSVNNQRTAWLALARQGADGGHGRELLIPPLRITKSHAAGNIRVGHAGSDAPPVGQSGGVPPAILKGFDEDARVVAAAIKEATDADEAVGVNKTRAAATGESGDATGGINDESGREPTA